MPLVYHYDTIGTYIHGTKMVYWDQNDMYWDQNGTPMVSNWYTIDTLLASILVTFRVTLLVSLLVCNLLVTGNSLVPQVELYSLVIQ